MHSHNTPISVWHGQPFEVPVLEGDARWAVVKYQSPKEKPGTWRPMSSWFVVRKGQSFSAVGNAHCGSIRVWSFDGLFSIPRKRTVQLAVRRLDKKPLPHVHTSTPEPRINAAVAMDIQHHVLSNTSLRVASFTTPAIPSFNLQPFNLQFTSPTDEPELKDFDSTL